ncbi:MAG: hypothetical protein BJ554DRAFT_3437, partial [Olpidium bornovanus]
KRKTKKKKNYSSRVGLVVHLDDEEDGSRVTFRADDPPDGLVVDDVA